MFNHFCQFNVLAAGGCSGSKGPKYDRWSCCWEFGLIWRQSPNVFRLEHLQSWNLAFALKLLALPWSCQSPNPSCPQRLSVPSCRCHIPCSGPPIYQALGFRNLRSDRHWGKNLAWISELIQFYLGQPYNPDALPDHPTLPLTWAGFMPQ